MKAHEKRAEAARLRAEARALEGRLNASEGPIGDADMAAYEDLNRRARALLDEADAAETREREANELDAMLRRQEARDADPGANPAGLPDMPHHRRGASYSLLRAIRLRAEGRPVDGLEGEVSAELARRMARSPQGFFAPLDLPVGPVHTRADLTLITGAGAKGTITATTLIELLRNRLVVAKAGARFLTGMTSDFSIPAQTAAATASWVAEGNAPASTAQTIGTVLFQPKTVSARTLVTRKFLLQSSIDAEQFVRDDLTAVLAIAIETATFHGPPAAPQLSILGLSDIAGVPAVPALGTDGGALTWAAVVGFESLITAANADGGSMAYVGNSKVRGHLKTVLKVGTTFPVYLADPDGSVNTYPFLMTNCVSSTLSKGASSGILSALFFGNWVDYVYAMWGAVDLLVDPYTSGSSGGVNVYALQDIDGKPRHNASFSKCLEVLAT